MSIGMYVYDTFLTLASIESNHGKTFMSGSFIVALIPYGILLKASKYICKSYNIKLKL